MVHTTEANNKAATPYLSCQRRLASRHPWLTLCQVLIVPIALTALLTSAWAETIDEADMGPGLSLTIYNQDLAVIKERRLIELPRGRGTVKFEDVAQRIIPQSVQFSSLTDPTRTTVIEQNYEFDLVSADKLLDKYIDKPVRIITQDGSLVSGTLLSFDRSQLLLRDDVDDSIQLLPRAKNVRDIQFSTLPEGFLTKPTLVWLVDARKAGQHLAKVAYQSHGFTWRADYTALVAPDHQSMTLAGWVTITNNSGASYHDAGLKLMAGDVHVVQEARELAGSVATSNLRAAGKAGSGFEEKSFAEYHLYTLGRRTSLLDKQVKQIELFPIVETVPVHKKYLYRANRDVGVYLEVKNSKENNLGMPLPGGKVRIYQNDIDSAREFIGDDSIDHTPKDEPVKVRMGRAFDIAAERTQTDQQRPARRVQVETFKITLRNHKDQAIKMAVEDYLHPRRNWKITSTSDEYTQKDYRTVVFEKEMPANSEWVITYTVRYSW